MKTFKVVSTIIVAILIVLNLYSLDYDNLSWSKNQPVYNGLIAYVLILLGLKIDHLYFKWRGGKGKI